ncbi:unnamed protein product [Dracunculus medinensis]|uniref:UDP-N-acetylglucosamine transporter n=1 Tax=Dracunculus medinensis TaxID=318479 RepID=A0A0N4UM33_DRAME|nr:unnamed protein product [Dracunculus medinensis]
MCLQVKNYSDDKNVQFLYKYFGIILLILQQASMPLLARLSRYRKPSEVFITTVNVLTMEVIKLVVCSVVVAVNENSLRRFLAQFHVAVIQEPTEMFKLCVPGLIYAFQNNLYYIALSHLDAAVFYLLYQTKILTTTIFLRIFLGRSFSLRQWLALVLLIIGVADLHLNHKSPKLSPGIEQNPTLGLIAVFMMCVTSAFAGVYLEKILKQSAISIWMQNVRLSLVSIPLCATSMLLKDYAVITKDGAFRGFDLLVWIMTISNSVGGILISIVVKYADNILKAYAQSIAIIGAAIGSWIFFDFTPNFEFILASSIVILSVYIYTAYPYKTAQTV